MSTRNSATRWKSQLVVLNGSIPQKYLVTLSLDGKTCVSKITISLEEQAWVVSASVSLHDRSTVITILHVENVGKLADEFQMLQDYEEVDSGHDISGKESDIWRAELPVSGLTCNSCGGSVNATLNKIPWSKSVDVNSISGSMAVVLKGKHHISPISTAAEDLSYAAGLGDVVRVDSVQTNDDRRKLLINEGVYCA